MPNEREKLADELVDEAQYLGGHLSRVLIRAAALLREDEQVMPELDGYLNDIEIHLRSLPQHVATRKTATMLKWSVAQLRRLAAGGSMSDERAQPEADGTDDGNARRMTEGDQH